MADFQWINDGKNIFDSSYGDVTLTSPSDRNNPFCLEDSGSLIVDSRFSLNIIPEKITSYMYWEETCNVIIKNGTLKLKSEIVPGEEGGHTLELHPNPSDWLINNNGNFFIYDFYTIVQGYFDENNIKNFLLGRGKSKTEIISKNIPVSSSHIQMIDDSSLIFKFDPGGRTDNYMYSFGYSHISVINNSKIDIYSDSILFTDTLYYSNASIYIGQSPKNKDIYKDSNVYTASITIQPNLSTELPIDFISKKPNVKFVFRKTDNKGNPIFNNGTLRLKGLKDTQATAFRQGGYLFIDDEQISESDLDNRFIFSSVNGTVFVSVK